MLPDSDDHTRLIEGLRAWAGTGDAHVAAAVRLLIADGHWLRDETFVAQCLTTDADGLVWVNWADARRRIEAGEFARASSTQRAVLDFAVALGQNLYRTSIMGGRTGALMVEALGHAFGVAAPSGR